MVLGLRRGLGGRSGGRERPLYAVRRLFPAGSRGGMLVSLAMLLAFHVPRKYDAVSVQAARSAALWSPFPVIGTSRTGVRPLCTVIGAAGSVVVLALARADQGSASVLP